MIVLEILRKIKVEIEMLEDIIGHERVVAILKNAFETKRLAHAYLFFGPDGVGKLYTAITFSKALLGNKYHDVRTHPDLHFITQPQNESITIEAIRQIQNAISLKPYEADKKVVIIDKIENITLQAGNAFLKVLEEPPDYVVFILITSSLHSILPTILSRCQLIKFTYLSMQDACSILTKHFNFKEETASTALLFTNGKIGEAIRLNLQRADKIHNLVLRIITNIDFDILDEIQTLINNEEIFLLLESIIIIIRDIIIDMETKDSSYNLLINNHNMPLYPNKEQYDIANYFVLYDIVIDTWNALLRNVKPELALESMLLKVKGEVLA